MSINRCVYTVGNTPESGRSAAHLGKVFFPDAKAVVRDLSSSECFDGLTQQDFSKIVVVGNGSTTQYGGYTAREFAKVFVKRFLENHSVKSANTVRDLYLIGCNIGVIKDDNGSSLAQEISNELYDLGFTKIVIHCVAKPENAKGDYLYMDVLNCSGSAGLLALTSALSHRAGGLSDVQTGYIKAYLLAAEDADRIQLLEKNHHRNHQEIAQIIRKKSFLLVNHANPEVELNKPHNIFHPYETFEFRRSRILRDSARQLSKQHAEAIALLVSRSNYLAQQSLFKDSMMSKKLDFLIFQLRLTDEHHWQPLLTEYTRYLKNHIIYGRFFNDDSNTQKLLTALGKNDFKTANKILNDQGSLSKSKSQNPLLPFFGRGKLAAAQTRAQTMPTDTRLLPYQLLERIDQLQRDLSDEIDQIKSGFFAMFYTYEVNTKLAKLAVVNALRSCHDVNAAQMIAREAIQNPRVMRSMRHSRTRDLLEEISQINPVSNRMGAASK